MSYPLPLQSLDGTFVNNTPDLAYQQLMNTPAVIFTPVLTADPMSQATVPQCQYSTSQSYSAGLGISNAQTAAYGDGVEESPDENLYSSKLSTSYLPQQEYFSPRLPVNGSSYVSLNNAWSDPNLAGDRQYATLPVMIYQDDVHPPPYTDVYDDTSRHSSQESLGVSYQGHHQYVDNPQAHRHQEEYTHGGQEDHLYHEFHQEQAQIQQF
jgi:hypothetical protein